MAKDKKKGKAAKKSGPPPKQKLNPQQKKQLKKATDGLIREGNELQERAQQQTCLAAEVRGVMAVVARTGNELRSSLAMARRKAAAAAQEGSEGREAEQRWQKQCKEQARRAEHVGAIAGLRRPE